MRNSVARWIGLLGRIYATGKIINFAASLGENFFASSNFVNWGSGYKGRDEIERSEEKSSELLFLREHLSLK